MKRKRFGEWPFPRKPQQGELPGLTPHETFYAISAVDGAIAVANNGDRATHGGQTP